VIVVQLYLSYSNKAISTKIGEIFEMKRYSANGYRTDRVQQREKAQILKLRKKGLTYQEIAHELQRSWLTIRKHIEEAKQKQDETKVQHVDKEKQDNHTKQLVQVANMLCFFVGKSGTTDEGLSKDLKIGINLVRDDPDYGEEYFDFFLSHIKSEHPDIESERKYKAISESDPKRIRRILKTVIARGTLTGRCEACP